MTFRAPPGGRESLHQLIFGGVAAGILFAIVQATSIRMVRQVPRSWSEVFALTLPSWIFVGLSLPATTMIARRYAFEAHNRRMSVVVHATISVVFALVQLAVMSLTYLFFASAMPSGTSFSSIFVVAFRYLFFSEILAYWAFVGIYLALRHSQVEARVAQNHLELLRAQLNPHFLFNTLNAVSALAQQGHQEAVTESLALLSELLRSALGEHAPEVKLGREMELVDAYLALQSIRFESRLRVTRAIAPGTLDGFVPPLVLQPIIENALEHGRRGSEINLTVAAMRDNRLLVLDVLDDGSGFPPGGPREGTGLKNVRARLAALYGPASHIEFGTSAQGGASVRVSIPFHSREGSYSNHERPRS